MVSLRQRVEESDLEVMLRERLGGERLGGDRWPVSFLVTSNKQSFEAYALGANAVAFRGATALSPNWIAPLVLHTDPMLDMFTNVTVCQPLSDGSFAMVAQPFGIAGPCKQQWFELLERTRPSAS